MKRIVAAVALAVLMAFASASAEVSEARAVQAFSHGGKLYAYLELAGWDAEYLKARVLIGETSYNDAAPVNAVKDLKPTIYYLLLVDNSTSMPAFKDEVTAFAEAFVKAAGQSSRFALAAFGEGLGTLGEFQAGAAVLDELAAVNYDENQTSLYGALHSALEHYRKLGRKGNELYNIVVITDGAEYDKAGVTLEEIEREAGGATVAIHTLGFPNTLEMTAEESEKALKALGVFARTTMGVHSVVGYGGKSAEGIASDIVGYTESLYAVECDIASFKSGGGEYPVTIALHAMGKTRGEAQMDIVIPIIPLTPEPGTSDPDLTPEPSSSAPELTPEPGAPEPEQAPEPSSSDPGSPDPGTLYIIGGAALLAAIAFFAVRKLKRPKSGTSEGIYMRLEVQSGSLSSRSKELYLLDELIIGRAKGCDIEFKDGGVSARNSRIFIRDNLIYIEDLGSQNGTSISDMRLHAPNRLRSGDAISIGNVRFTLKF